MKSTTKDCLIGTVFALSTLFIQGLSYSIFSSLKFDVALFFAPFLIAILSVPIYFICKQDRRWHYGVAVAVTNVIVMLPLTVMVSMLAGWINFGSLLIDLLIFHLGLLPPAIDLLIVIAKAFWNWLGSKMEA